jgi:aspartate racemase
VKTKLIGMIGGIGPESTIDYYRLFVSIYREHRPDGGYPPLLINSIDLARALKLVSSGDLEGLAAYMLEEIHRLARAGATHGLLSSNTPHIVFDEIAAQSPLPLISIVEACAEEAKRLALKRLLLLGTRFTMEAPFYPVVFARHGITVLTPNNAERTWVHERYIGELLKGEFRAGTREQFVALVTHIRKEERIDAVILGGTELPLLLTAPTIAELPALDTTALHVEAIVKRLRAE